MEQLSLTNDEKERNLKTKDRQRKLAALLYIWCSLRRKSVLMAKYLLLNRNLNCVGDRFYHFDS